MFTLTEAGRRKPGAFAGEPTRRPTALSDELLIMIQAMGGNAFETQNGRWCERVLTLLTQRAPLG